ncbi:hypothetical protein [Streptomyces marianii]|nr:hypothetical protein [Streptomyces marianii]
MFLTISTTGTPERPAIDLGASCCTSTPATSVQRESRRELVQLRAVP